MYAAFSFEQVQFGDSEWISASVLATSSNKQLLLMDKDLTLKWMALKVFIVIFISSSSYNNT
jgi:hypothetical protein